MKTSMAILLLLAAFSGCNTVSPLESSRIKNEPFIIDNTYKYAKQDANKVKQGTKLGTIWRGETASNSYFIDQRAKGIGDIITIKIVEVSQASEKATTDTGRTSDIDAGVTHFFGWEKNYPANVNPEHLITANTKNNFAGTGETKREGSMSATISAKVVDVLPSGNLAIEGKRELYVNNEKKEILLQGIVRQKDIAADNTILSTQVADAKVMYTGIGVIGEKQRPGWLTRVFDIVWPF
jgi:flagellar L-ring protein FlgH